MVTLRSNINCCDVLHVKIHERMHVKALNKVFVKQSDVKHAVQGYFEHNKYDATQTQKKQSNCDGRNSSHLSLLSNYLRKQWTHNFLFLFLSHILVLLLLSHILHLFSLFYVQCVCLFSMFQHGFFCNIPMDLIIHQ